MESLGIDRVQGWFRDPNTAGKSWAVLPDDCTIRRLIVSHGVAPAGTRDFAVEIEDVVVPGLALVGVIGPAEARPTGTLHHIAKGGAVEITNDGDGAGAGVAHWVLEFTRGRS